MIVFCSNSLLQLIKAEAIGSHCPNSTCHLKQDIARHPKRRPLGPTFI